MMRVCLDILMGWGAYYGKEMWKHWETKKTLGNKFQGWEIF